MAAAGGSGGSSSSRWWVKAVEESKEAATKGREVKDARPAESRCSTAAYMRLGLPAYRILSKSLTGAAFGLN
jgi:hypothetical protein